MATTAKALFEAFAGRKRCRIAVEVGTHSPWVSRVLKGMGHEVFVANARQVGLITHSSRKHDRSLYGTRARWHGSRESIRDCYRRSSIAVNRRNNA